jgi:hypothetical protein
MCDGEKRLKAHGAGMVPFPVRKGEPTPETEQIFLAGGNLRVLEITILITL